MSDIYNIIKDDIKTTIRTMMDFSIIFNPTFSEKCCTFKSISSKLDGPKINKSKTYVDNFLKFYNNNEYLFQFKDNSLLQIKYEFYKDESTRNKVVSKANLNFLPNPGLYDADILEMLKSDSLSEDEQVQFWEEIRSDINQDFVYHSNYMRLDYSCHDEDFSELIHPRCHIHLGLHNDFRLATNKLPLLSDFVDLVLFANYNDEWKKIHEENIDDLSKYLSHRRSKSQNYVQLTEFDDVLTEVESSNYLLKLI